MYKDLDDKKLSRMTKIKRVSEIDLHVLLKKLLNLFLDSILDNLSS